MNFEKLALLHYKKLISITGGAGALNNMGVCYGSLKLKGKSVSSYEASAKGNITLAMGNLAHSYLDGGFINDAKELIDKANKLSVGGIEVDSRVGAAWGKLKAMQEEEDETEGRLIKEAKEEREFRVRHAEGMLSSRLVNGKEIEGPWETPWGEVKIEFDEMANSFSMRTHQKVEMPDYSLIFSNLTGARAAPKQYQDRYVKIDGQISAMSGRCRIVIDDKRGTTLLTQGNVYSGRGYMIIKDGCEEIEIMEKSAEDKTEFRSWKKVRGPGA